MTSAYAPHIVDAHELPPELVRMRSWICWRLVQKPGKAKPDKIPISPITGRKTDWLNPANHGDFETARDYAEAHKLHGLGIVLEPGCGLAGGDLDHCIDPATGEVSEAARGILEEASTYSEISPGLTGIRFIARGSFGGYTGTDHAAGIEFYEAGRFLTITGNHIDETPFAVEKRDLTALGRRFFDKKSEPPPQGAEAGPWHPVDIDALPISDFTRNVITSGDASAYGGDRSKALFGVAKDLLRAGLSNEDCARVLTDPNHGISAKALEERHGDVASALEWVLKYTVLPARREVLEEPPPVDFQFHQGGESAEGFLHVSLDGLSAAILDPPQFILTPLIPRGHVTLLGGHGGAGKSVLALTLAAHIAAGRPWGPLEATGGRALYVSLEDPGALVLYRLKRIVEAYRLPADDVVARMRIIDGTEAGPIGEEVSAQGVRRLRMTTSAAQVAELASDYDVIVIDNASDAFDGDENNRRQVRTFLKALTRWVRAHDGAVLLLAHIDKSAARFGANGNTYSGTTAWHNSARSRLALTDREGVIELAHEKLNVGKKLADPVRLSWSDAGVLVPYDPTGLEAAANIVNHADDIAVLAALKAALDAGEVVPVSRSGPATAWHCLCAYGELPAMLKTKAGKGRLDASLVRLARGGFIRREAYRNAHRHDREKWVLPEDCANVRQCCANDD